jgi:hypothetical protein
MISSSRIDGVVALLMARFNSRRVRLISWWLRICRLLGRGATGSARSKKLRASGIARRRMEPGWRAGPLSAQAPLHPGQTSST